MNDQFAHLVKQLSAQQSGTDAFFRYGHIATYDPATHRIRAVVPSWRDEAGNPVLTGWMPLASPWVGSGWGMQAAPLAGATFENPTGGEQVLLALLDRTRGVLAVPCQFFTDAMLPPGVLPGEAILKHATGSFIRLHANGDIEVNAAGNIIATAAGNIAATAAGNLTASATDATVTASGNAAVLAPSVKIGRALADAMQGLCTGAFQTWAESHTHSDENGSPTGPPTSAPPSNALTSVLTAE